MPNCSLLAGKKPPGSKFCKQTTALRCPTVGVRACEGHFSWGPDSDTEPHEVYQPDIGMPHQGQTQGAWVLRQREGPAGLKVFPSVPISSQILSASLCPVCPLLLLKSFTFLI